MLSARLERIDNGCRSSSKNGDGFHFAEDVLGQGLDRHTRPCRLCVRGEILGVYGVEGGEIIHGRDEASRLDDCGEINIGLEKDCLEVLHDHAGLGFDATFYDETRGGIDGDLAGCEEESVGGDCLRVWTYCGGCFGGVDDFHDCSFGWRGDCTEPFWNNGPIGGSCQME